MSKSFLVGVLLAGGRSTRMNGEDKGLIRLLEKPLYQHVLSRLQPQVLHTLICANRNLADYQASGCTVISDRLKNYLGPLAGMLSAFEYSTAEWFLFVPCDMPLIPQDLGQRLWEGRNQRVIVYAHDGERSHPTLALIHRSVQAKMENYLQQGNRKLMLFYEQLAAQPVYFDHSSANFHNLNTNEECLQWEKSIMR